jgi:predicted  nucleic acid-binding Zn-ribbon protein
MSWLPTFDEAGVMTPLEPSGASPMDSEHRDLMAKARALIETSRREISQLREEIESARNTVDRSQRLLSRTEPSTNRILKPAKAL